MTLLSKWDGVAQEPEDLNRKFHNSFVKATINKKTGVIRISSIEGSTVYGYFIDKTEYSVRTSDLDILCPLPERGVYQAGKSIILFRRNAFRQWGEGLSDSTGSALINGETKVKTIDMSIAERVFSDQENTCIEQALTLVKEGQSLRLNQNYWIRKEKDGTTNLFRGRARLGSWVCNRFFWQPDAKPFKEELKDELMFHA